MPKYNIKITDIDTAYFQGLLPQRNNKEFFYQDTSCRSNLKEFKLSSENRRIINKTQEFTFEKIPVKFDLEIQKRIFGWVKTLNWDFPISSVKSVFTKHIFNYLYVWYDPHKNVVAYSLCFYSSKISHIAYVFYDPKYDHSNLPIRLVLEVIIDSKNQNLDYCYLGRFSQDTGYYKRTMPGFEYFQNNNWISFSPLSRGDVQRTEGF
jgi:hypothetical protein